MTRIMRNLSTTLPLINQKSGNYFAVFDIYLPFIGLFNLRAIKFRTRKSLRYEMVYVTKLLEIHQRRGCKDPEMVKDYGVWN